MKPSSGEGSESEDFEDLLESRPNPFSSLDDNVNLETIRISPEAKEEIKSLLERRGREHLSGDSKEDSGDAASYSLESLSEQWEPAFAEDTLLSTEAEYFDYENEINKILKAKSAVKRKSTRTVLVQKSFSEFRALDWKSPWKGATISLCSSSPASIRKYSSCSSSLLKRAIMKA